MRAQLIEIDPPAISRPSQMQQEIEAVRTAVGLVKTTTEARDAAMKDAGRLLMQIRERVPIGWGEFCEKELGISASWANRLIRYAKGTDSPEADRDYAEARREAVRRSTGPDEEDITVAKIKRDVTMAEPFTKPMFAEISAGGNAPHPCRSIR